MVTRLRIRAFLLLFAAVALPLVLTLANVRDDMALVLPSAVCAIFALVFGWTAELARRVVVQGESWSCTPEEWARFVTLRDGLDKADDDAPGMRKALGFTLLVATGIALVVSRGNVNLTARIVVMLAFGTGGLLAGIVLLVALSRRRALRGPMSPVWVSSDAIAFEAKVWPLRKLASADQPAPGVLRLRWQARSTGRGGLHTPTLLLPIPAAHLAAVQQFVERMDVLTGNGKRRLRPLDAS